MPTQFSSEGARRRDDATDFEVRLCRIESPTFLVSDVRKRGYANLWVRPPIEVYGVQPLTNSDGVDCS